MCILRQYNYRWTSLNKNHRESLCHLTVIVIPPNQAEEGWSLINTYFRHVPGESQISVIMSALYIGMVQILTRRDGPGLRRLSEAAFRSRKQTEKNYYTLYLSLFKKKKT